EARRAPPGGTGGAERVVVGVVGTGPVDRRTGGTDERRRGGDRDQQTGGEDEQALTTGHEVLPDIELLRCLSASGPNVQSFQGFQPAAIRCPGRAAAPRTNLTIFKIELILTYLYGALGV